MIINGKEITKEDLVLDEKPRFLGIAYEDKREAQMILAETTFRYNINRLLFGLGITEKDAEQMIEKVIESAVVWKAVFNDYDKCLAEFVGSVEITEETDEDHLADRRDFEKDLGPEGNREASEDDGGDGGSTMGEGETVLSFKCPTCKGEYKYSLTPDETKYGVGLECKNCENIIEVGYKKLSHRLEVLT